MWERERGRDYWWVESVAWCWSSRSACYNWEVSPGLRLQSQVSVSQSVSESVLVKDLRGAGLNLSAVPGVVCSPQSAVWLSWLTLHYWHCSALSLSPAGPARARPDSQTASQTIINTEQFYYHSFYHFSIHSASSPPPPTTSHHPRPPHWGLTCDWSRVVNKDTFFSTDLPAG